MLDPDRFRTDQEESMALRHRIFETILSHFPDTPSEVLAVIRIQDMYYSDLIASNTESNRRLLETFEKDNSNLVEAATELREKARNILIGTTAVSTS